MKFCPECGTKNEGFEFCPNCGNNFTNSTSNLNDDDLSSNSNLGLSDVQVRNLDTLINVLNKYSPNLENWNNNPILKLIKYNGFDCYYEGNLSNDKPLGFGKVYEVPDSWDYMDGIKEPWLSYEGYWENGLPNGLGTKYLVPNSIHRYIGEFKNGGCDGLGKIFDTNGEIVRIGIFKDGEFIGDIEDEIDDSPIPSKDGAGIR